MSDNKKKIEPEFDEEQALKELRFIIAMALYTQNFEALEHDLEIWNRKYPLSKFTNKDIKAEVKKILNRNTLSQLLGDYLAAKILQDRQKQKEAYESLRKIIQNADKSKDYKTAERQVKRWKADLSANDMSLYGFDRYYRSKIFSLLLIPRNKLKDEENATRDLKQLYDKAQKLDSEELSKGITSWQNKYCVNGFNGNLQKELNTITADIFKSISDKRNEENCIKDLTELASKKSIENPVDALASALSKYDYTRFSKGAQNTIESLSKQVLAIPDSLLKDTLDISDTADMEEVLSQVTASALELTAINDLKKIFDRNARDMSAILKWIYDNRKLNYSQYARDEIIRLFIKEGYRIPEQAAYFIPEVKSTLIGSNSSDIKKAMLGVIQNYLGILYTGNTLTKTAKENVLAASVTSQVIDSISEEEHALDSLDSEAQIEEKAEKEVRKTVKEKPAEEKLISQNEQEVDTEPLLELPAFDNEQTPKQEAKEITNNIFVPGVMEEDTNIVIIDDDFLRNPETIIVPIDSPEEQMQEQNQEEVQAQEQTTSTSTQLDENAKDYFYIPAFSDEESISIQKSMDSNDLSTSSSAEPKYVYEADKVESSDILYTIEASDNEPKQGKTSSKSGTYSELENDNISPIYTLPEEEQEKVADAYESVMYISVAYPIMQKALAHQNTLKLEHEKDLPY